MVSTQILHGFQCHGHTGVQRCISACSHLLVTLHDWAGAPRVIASKWGCMDGMHITYHPVRNVSQLGR